MEKTMTTSTNTTSTTTTSTTTKKVKYNPLVNGLKTIDLLDEDGKKVLLEDGTKASTIGKSKYALALENETLKETQFNAHNLEKVVPSKYEINVNSKGFTLYEGKTRALDVKVQKGRVKIFNHCSIESIEGLKEYATIEEDIPSYKKALFTNCVYVDNKYAIKAIRTIIKNS